VQVVATESNVITFCTRIFIYITVFIQLVSTLRIIFRQIT